MTITVEASILPAAPENLTATPGNGQIALSWDDPQDESVRRYQIRLRKAGDPWGSWGHGWTIRPGTRITLPGMVNGETYTVQVRAVNANGAGPAATSEPVTPSR